MNYYRVLTALVLILGTINGFPAELQETGAVNAQQPQESGAAVIEFKKQAKDANAKETKTKDTASSNPAGSSVELIVGGSGEGGVAKRREMPVEK